MNRNDPLGRPLPTPAEEAAFDAALEAAKAPFREAALAEGGMPISAGWATGERRRLQPTPAPAASPDEAEFMEAMSRYKREHRRPFPTWGEVLDVLKSLGYRRDIPPHDGPTADRAGG